MSERITTPFGAESTAAEVIAGVDLAGKRAIVTGGASGIGIETAQALASAGAEVTLAVRDVAAGAKAAAEFGGLARHLDLTDLASVARFAGDWTGPLDILVNNAGIMATPLLRTSRGWELQFATNHLGHFALATALHGALAAADGARIVSVSSVGHLVSSEHGGGGIDFDDLQFDRRPYDKWVAYGQSKTANILFAVEAAKRWAGDGITANALNPGRIPGTGLMRHLEDAPAAVTNDSAGVSWKNAEQGAATSVLLAASPLLGAFGGGVTGLYFEDCNQALPYEPGVRRGVADYALDADTASRLWQVSLDLLQT